MVVADGLGRLSYTDGMDTRAYEFLLAFHVGANQGSLHVLDDQQLQTFIHHVAAQAVTTDDIVHESFKFLTTQSDRPWGEELARELVRRIRAGVDLLRYQD